MPITKSKGKKPNLLKVDADSSESDGNSSEHELFYYKKDKVKLMKEVLKLIKPKKIKQMAPDCIKHLDIAEINSMLLEELLGISNKRLRYIFNGENVDRDSSSSDSDEDKAIDVISLDDISSDDEILCLDDVKDDPKTKSTKIQSAKRRHKHRHHKIKQEQSEVSSDKQVKRKKVKKEKDDLPKESEKDKLMSVLEILELQARARAIKSQLLLETQAKKQAAEQEAPTQVDDGSDSDVLIEEVGGTEEIVITSESENEANTSSSEKVGESVEEKKNRLEKRIQKRIRLKRNTLNINKESDVETPAPHVPNILEGTEDGTIDQYNRLLTLNDKNGTTSQENGKQDAPNNQDNLENKDSSPISNDKMEENESIQKEATKTSTQKDTTSVDKAEEGEIIEYQEDSDNKAEEGEVFNKSVREDTSSDKDGGTKKPEKEANPEVSMETNDGDCAIVINLDDDEIDEMNNA